MLNVCYAMAKCNKHKIVATESDSKILKSLTVYRLVERYPRKLVCRMISNKVPEVLEEINRIRIEMKRSEIVTVWVI